MIDSLEITMLALVLPSRDAAAFGRWGEGGEGEESGAKGQKGLSLGCVCLCVTWSDLVCLVCLVAYPSRTSLLFAAGW